MAYDYSAYSRRIADINQRTQRYQGLYGNTSLSRDQIQGLKGELGLAPGATYDSTGRSTSFSGDKYNNEQAAKSAYLDMQQSDAALGGALQNRINSLKHEKIAAMGEMVNDAPGPESLAAETGGYQAKTYAGPTALPEFDIARKHINDQANVVGQQQDDALQRRFAALGGLGSGSLIKQQSIATDQNENRRSDALQATNAQEAQAVAGFKKDFDQQESQKEFSSGESMKGRNMQRELYNSDSKFKDMVFRFDSNSKLSQLDMALDQQALDEKNNEYNKELNDYQQKHSGGLFGGGGFLGTGIGA